MNEEKQEMVVTEENTENEKEKEKNRHNPALRKAREMAEEMEAVEEGAAATTRGAYYKIIGLLVAVFASAVVSFQFLSAVPSTVLKTVLGLALAAFGVGIYTCRHPEKSSKLAPLYAVLEGAALGQLAALDWAAKSGMVIQALLITFIIAALVIVVFSHEWFKVHPAFRSVVVLATGAIALLYLADLVLILGFDMNITLIHDVGWKGIAFSLFAIFVAVCNLALDYVEIRDLSKKNMPAYFEWFLAFGFMVSLIWLYLEISRFLRK